MAPSGAERSATGQRDVERFEQEHYCARVAIQMITAYVSLSHQGPQPECVVVD